MEWHGQQCLLLVNSSTAAITQQKVTLKVTSIVTRTVTRRFSRQKCSATRACSRELRCPPPPRAQLAVGDKDMLRIPCSGCARLRWLRFAGNAHLS